MATERFSLEGKWSEQCLRVIMLAIQKFKRIANRTIFSRDIADERFCNRRIVSVMKAIFQDGGQTVNYMSKRYKRSIEGLHLRYTKTQTRWKLRPVEAEISQIFCSTRLMLSQKTPFFKVAANRLTMG